MIFLLKLSVGLLYEEEDLHVLREKSFDVTYFNDTTSTGEYCRVLTKPIAWIAEDAGNKFRPMNKKLTGSG